MKVWVTKYALSGGVEELEGSPTTEGYFSVNSRYGLLGRSDWYVRKDQAIADAEARRVKKIASLRKQIAKLEALRFDQ